MVDFLGFTFNFKLLLAAKTVMVLLKVSLLEKIQENIFSKICHTVDGSEIRVGHQLIW